MQSEIHLRCTAPDFTIAVEQNFALPADGVLFFRISLIKNVSARLCHAIPNENLPGKLAKIIRTLARRRLIGTADKRDFRTKIAQSRRQQFGYAQRQIALLDRLSVADLKPTLLHLRPAAS